MTPTITTVAEWAIEYALCGVPVFPLHYPTEGRCSCGKDCGNIGKHPATRNGLNDATLDTDDITKVWNHRPFNIGLATGHAFDVLDIDSADAIPAVEAVLGRPAGEGLLREDDVYAQTGRGFHVLYAPTGGGNRVRILPGVDWRGLGGYIVAPPSVHANGHTYRWGPNGFTSPCVAPGEILALLERPEPQRRTIDATEVALLTLVERLDLQDAHGSLAGVMRTMAEAVEGERNSVLFWCANRVVDDFHAHRFDGEAYRGHLGDLKDVALAVGLDDHEIMLTINSARKARSE